MLLIPKRHRRTDGQTDRQTDGRLTVALPRSALASRGNKCWHECREMQTSEELNLLRLVQLTIRCEYVMKCIKHVHVYMCHFCVNPNKLNFSDNTCVIGVDQRFLTGS